MMATNFLFIILLSFFVVHGYHHVSEYSSDVSYDDINDGESVIEHFIRRVRSFEENYTHTKTIKKIDETSPEQERYKRSSVDDKVGFFASTLSPIYNYEIFKDETAKDTTSEEESIFEDTPPEDFILEDVSSEDVISADPIFIDPQPNVTLLNIFGHKLLIPRLNPSMVVRIGNDSDNDNRDTIQVEDIKEEITGAIKEEPDNCCVGDEIDFTSSDIESPQEEDVNHPDPTFNRGVIKIRITIPITKNKQHSRRSRQLLTANPGTKTPGKAINPTLPEVHPKEAFPIIQIREIPPLPEHGIYSPVPVIRLSPDHINATVLRNNGSITDPLNAHNDLISDSLSHPLHLFDLDEKNASESLLPKPRKRHYIKCLKCVQGNHSLLFNNNANENNLQENNMTEIYLQGNSTENYLQVYNITESKEESRQNNLSPSTPLLNFNYTTPYLHPMIPPNTPTSPQSTYQEKVSTGVTVEETQKNPERRIYGYVGV